MRILSGVQYFQIYGQTPGPLPSSEPLYKKLEILKFDDIFKLNIANFVYATLDFESPPIFHDWFVFEHEIHDHSTRMSTELQQTHHFDIGVIQQSLKLQIKGSNNNYGKKTLKTIGPTIWNSIPDYIVKTSSANCFKITYKKFLIENYDRQNGINDNNNQNNTADNNNNRNRNNYNRNRRNDRATRNNNYGRLDNRRQGNRFQSRWDLEIGESTNLI